MLNVECRRSNILQDILEEEKKEARLDEKSKNTKHPAPKSNPELTPSLAKYDSSPGAIYYTFCEMVWL
jgi:hypothetical protein